MKKIYFKLKLKKENNKKKLRCTNILNKMQSNAVNLFVFKI